MSKLSLTGFLISVLKTLVKNPVKGSFDITFMGNEISVKILIDFFSFPIKTFFNWILTSVLRALVSTTILNEATKKVSPNRLIF